MGELSLVRSQPTGVEGGIGKEGVSNDGNDTGSGTLDDEEPLPSGVAELAVELEDTGSDETSKGCGENVTSVEDSDSGGDFGTGVEV